MEPSAGWSGVSHGNPLYMKELLGYLVDSGRLDEAGGIWKLSNSFEYMVPDSLTGLIRSRIDRMPPDQKNLLQYCSVLGTRLFFEPLPRILPWE